MTQQTTKIKILSEAREILAAGGLAALSFDAIAGRLGKTKQAVLYWYPTKHDLLAALFLPWLEEEADTVILALENTSGRDEAIRAFVQAVLQFHLDDLDRFRMMYLLPQTLRPLANPNHNARVVEQVHPISDRLYTAFAAKLDGSRHRARQDAFAIHSAVLGLILMLSLAQSIDDPLKHSTAELAQSLIDMLTSKQL